MMIIKLLLIIMEGPNTLVFSSKFTWVGQIISSKFIDNSGLSTPKISPALVSVLPASVLTEPSWILLQQWGYNKNVFSLQ